MPHARKEQGFEREDDRQRTEDSEGTIGSENASAAKPRGCGDIFWHSGEAYKSLVSSKMRGRGRGAYRTGLGRRLPDKLGIYRENGDLELFWTPAVAT